MVDYQQILKQAAANLKNCRACIECNGKACAGLMPGPGSKGVGDVAVRNYEKWQEWRLCMDTIHDCFIPDTKIELFGRSFALPVFAGPVGAMKLHYGEHYSDAEYNDILVSACAQKGIAAFTGDGMDANVMLAATSAIKAANGSGIPTLKPWNQETIEEKMQLIKASGCFAFAMDIDAAGLPFLKGMQTPAGSKTVQELREIAAAIDVPFILKGIMTVKGAEKAIEAGVDAIIVSNHGGRVLDGCAATAEVLPEIASACKGRIKILVDGGIRSGADIFRAIALGADAVLIARPFVAAVYGGGAEGAACYIDKLSAELADAMEMCGAAKLSDITADMIKKF